MEKEREPKIDLLITIAGAVADMNHELVRKTPLSEHSPGQFSREAQSIIQETKRPHVYNPTPEQTKAYKDSKTVERNSAYLRENMQTIFKFLGKSEYTIVPYVYDADGNMSIASKIRKGVSQGNITIDNRDSQDIRYKINATELSEPEEICLRSLASAFGLRQIAWSSAR